MSWPGLTRLLLVNFHNPRYSYYSFFFFYVQHCLGKYEPTIFSLPAEGSKNLHKNAHRQTDREQKQKEFTTSSKFMAFMLNACKITTGHHHSCNLQFQFFPHQFRPAFAATRNGISPGHMNHCDCYCYPLLLPSPSLWSRPGYDTLPLEASPALDAFLEALSGPLPPYSDERPCQIETITMAST